MWKEGTCVGDFSGWLELLAGVEGGADFNSPRKQLLQTRDPSPVCSATQGSTFSLWLGLIVNQLPYQPPQKDSNIRCGEPAWGPPPMAKVMRKEARHTQRRDRASGIPLEILEHLPPKPESAYFTTLCSHLHLWLYGGLSPTTSFGEEFWLWHAMLITGGYSWRF